MRFSIVIAAHNEGEALWRTVTSCVETCAGLDYEIVVADDASWDGSVAQTQQRFPQVRVVRHEERQGASPAKDLGARSARGEVLVFLDGHTKPEPGAIRRLVQNVEALRGEALVTPAVAGLDATRWKTRSQQIGHGYFLELERLDCGWLPLSDLKRVSHRGRTFYESPAAIGCALAVHRELYDDLRGFDPHMLCWGVEDLDFSLKCWLLGHPILHDPEAVIGHRFRRQFDNFAVPVERLIVNQLRMARKNFTPGVWGEWVERCRRRHPGRLAEHPEGLWAAVWELFQERRASVEHERSYLMARRVRDEFWYAERFGLLWPRLQAERFEPAPVSLEPLQASPSPPPPPPPPPPPAGCCPDPDVWEWTNIMDPQCWYRINAATPQQQGFNWTLLENGAVWEVVPTALTDGIPGTTLDNPPRGPAFNEPRETNSVATKCLFGDFNLRFDFRCPDRRGVWTEGADCGDPLRGVRNWGNSGVYIFNLYEVQLHDSYNQASTPPGSTSVGVTGNQLFNAQNTLSLRVVSPTKTCRLSITELCGAIYRFRSPNTNQVKQASSAAQGSPNGEWNTMEIGFMSPRFDQNGVKVRCATVTVRLNGVSLYTRLGLPSGTGSRATWDEAIDLRDDSQYVNQNWRQSTGRIVLQEHDNKVQFRNIRINPAWIPTIGGQPTGEFDQNWQREYDSAAQEPWNKCR